MKFKAVIPQKSFKSILSVLSETVDEANFDITPNGIKVGSIDASNILLTKMSIPSDAFEYYDADSGRLGVDIKRMLEMVSSGDSLDMVSIELGDKLDLSVGNLHWSMSLIDPTSIRKEPNIPNMDLPAMVSIPGPMFKKAVVAAEKVTDHLRILMDDEVFKMYAKGDVEQMTLEMKQLDLFDIKFGCANSMFMLSYLKSISKATKDIDAIRLEFGVDYPLRISFVLKFDKSETHISYLLAPRIETD